MNKIKTLLILLTAGLLLAASSAMAQTEFSAEIRERGELRYGQGTLPEKGADPAAFISQRTRLKALFQQEKYRVYTAIQDVRVWGEDRSTISKSGISGGLMFHEAWMEADFSDTSSFLRKGLGLKIGRQELIYDDSRLLGNLDWLQQGRRHDMLLLKWGTPGLFIHAGLAYNQHREGKAETIYNAVPNGYPAGSNGIGAMYKSLQFMYLKKQIKTSYLSFLLVKDDFQRLDTAFAPVSGVNSRVTTGFYNEGIYKKNLWRGSVYYQTGKDRFGTDLSAWLASLYLQRTINNKWRSGLGVDYTSGNSNLGGGEVNRAFDPLYGTPHKFWGYMDYFYAADGFGGVGLTDWHFRNFVTIKKLNLNVDIHEFISAGKVYRNNDEMSRLSSRLGTEVDLVLSGKLAKGLFLEGGYSMFFATESLDVLKNPSKDNKLIASWAYVMLTAKPNLMK